MDLLTATDRLQTLVKDHLHGAKLLSFELTATGNFEVEFVVRWERDTSRGTQFGTHRAFLSERIDEGMLIWGHYFDGPAAGEECMKDYRARVERATSL